jgi:putative endonuclease
MYFVYILTNKWNTTLYVGFTDDVRRRVVEHREGKYERAFSMKYQTFKLVYFEQHDDIKAALHQEWLMKRWRKKWKTQLIEKGNPNWKDLFEDLAE